MNSSRPMRPLACYNIISLEDFVKNPENKFAIFRTLFSAGTPMDVADTTRSGRFIGQSSLYNMVCGHKNDRSWNGQFNRSHIFIVDYSRVEIWAPYCPVFSEQAMLNDCEILFGDH